MTELDEVMQERDRYEAVADKLADAIAAHFREDIGEHSSSNDPWQNALDLIEPVRAIYRENLMSVCGRCLVSVSRYNVYCPYCGQKIDWGEE